MLLSPFAVFWATFLGMLAIVVYNNEVEHSDRRPRYLIEATNYAHADADPEVVKETERWAASDVGYRGKRSLSGCAGGTFRACYRVFDSKIG